MVRAKEIHQTTNQVQENDIYTGLGGTSGAFFGIGNTASGNGALGDAAGGVLGNGNINGLNNGLTNGAEGK